MKTKITQISVARHDKAGQPYVSTYTNKAEALVTIQIDAPEFTGKKLSSFVEIGDPVEQWKIGQPVDILTSQKGNFWNFKVAKGATTQGAGTNQLFEKLFMKLQAMDAKLDVIIADMKNIEVVQDEPDPTYLPPLSTTPF